MKILLELIQRNIDNFFQNREAKRRRKYFKRGQKFFTQLMKRDLVELEQFESILKLKDMPDNIYNYYWLCGIEDAMRKCNTQNVIHVIHKM